MLDNQALPLALNEYGCSMLAVVDQARRQQFYRRQYMDMVFPETQRDVVRQTFLTTLREGACVHSRVVRCADGVTRRVTCASMRIVDGSEVVATAHIAHYAEVEDERLTHIVEELSSALSSL
eukprot:TRINITY_DN6325_c0_g1_i2.p3 TRINITY_DN6325_c0_g1~~TRINITY_DN6325_c0_g1_i2.p3  ORF type:complete len:122 (+),score=46.59 TRINITY_DN6325_c0_g1_i2:484-849(+)